MKKSAALIFLQMLPATLVVAAIRPLFVMFHRGDVSMMHAFMSLNMVGAILAATPLAMLADRMREPRRLLAALCALDGVLLLVCALPLPSALVLALRFVEGVAHVGATSLLLAEAAAIGKHRGEGKVMGVAGAAIVFAIAAGNAVGGMLTKISPQLPFVVAAGTAWFVAAVSWRRESAPRVVTVRARVPIRPLLLPISAAFVERFGVGSFVVSFSLFAHNRHALTDTSIGWLFFAFTFTFAIAMVPAGRISDRVSPRVMMAAGTLAYGLALLAIPASSSALLPWAMIAGGAGAAFTFAPSLTLVAASKQNRTAAMALISSAGCLGMTLGTAVSGIAIGIARRHMGDLSSAYALPIGIAAGALLLFSLAVAVLEVGIRPRQSLLKYGTQSFTQCGHRTPSGAGRAAGAVAEAHRLAD